LAACYANSLRLAAERALESVAFPAISTGVYGYPREEAARVASRAIKEFLTGALASDARRDGEKSEGEAEGVGSLGDVRLVFFSESDARVFLSHQQFETNEG
ncbi:MAG: macro domain-containing protein, partial [Acidobacteriota bacterium]|nr:macro domain-containing protein [Acidobacteriota bacterium]